MDEIISYVEQLLGLVCPLRKDPASFLQVRERLGCA